MKQLKSLELVANELASVEALMLSPDPNRHVMVNTAVNNLIKRGGKRIRPIITLLVCKMVNADCQLALNLASAVEMLHTATLVHDDIIDGALIRRGHPTLNATWSPGATILTGDYLFARAADFAARTNNVRVMRLFAQALMTICNGELHQMFSTHEENTDKQRYQDRIFAKTGALFVLATEASAVLAQTELHWEKDLYQFGKELGIAFQMIDDLLDFIGSESKVGKPLGSDLAQGLITLPTIFFLDQYPNDERIRIVLEGYRNNDDLQRALDAVRNSDAIQKTHDEAVLHANAAKDALVNLPDNIYRKTLLELADYTVNRRL